MPFPWRAGMLVTADRLNAHAPIYVFKGADEERTNSSTPAPDSILTLDLGEGLWQVEAFFDFSGTSGSAGLRTAWSTTMSTISIRRVAGPAAGSTDRINTSMWYAVHGMGTEVRYGNRQGTGLRSQAWESMVLQGPGNLTLLWSQVSSSSDVTRLAGGSYIRAERIG